MFEATGLKITASRTPSLAQPPSLINKNLLTVSKVDRETDTQTGR
jgi:hypothetical protein